MHGDRKCSHFLRYGIEGPQVYLIDFIPLIEMLWADGKGQVGEIVLLSEYINQHVEQLNTSAGHEVVSVASVRALVAQFLGERPDPELLRTLRSFIAPVRLASSDQAINDALRGSLMAACMDIASSCVVHYPFGGHERFSFDEKRCFFEILESLEAP
jgi:hypothetical protein